MLRRAHPRSFPHIEIVTDDGGGRPCRPPRCAGGLPLLLAGIVSLAACKAEAPPVQPDAAPQGGEAPAEGSAATEAEAEAEVTQDLPDAQIVLNQAVAAMGGEERVDAIDSYYLEFNMVVPGQNLTANSKTWWEQGKFFSETDMPGVGVTSVWGEDGRIWSRDPVNGKREVTGLEAHQNRWGTELVIAESWQQHFDDARTQARREVDGRALIDVILTDSTGDEVVLSFDEETGLMVEQLFTQVTPIGSSPIKQKYGEYQVLDGLKYQTSWVMEIGHMTAELSLVKLQTNIDIDWAKMMPGVTKPTVGPQPRPRSEDDSASEGDDQGDDKSATGT